MLKLLNWKWRYFKKKLRGVEKMIADFEFKRFKTLEIREEIRQEYDQSKARLEVLNTQIKQQQEKPTMEKDEIARLDDRKVLLERDIKKFEDQLKGLDLEVYGCAPNQDYHDGVQGINQQLDALRELVVMLKNYIKEL